MIRRIKPVSRAVRIEGEVNRILNAVLFRHPEPFRLDESWTPCMDVYEKEDEIVIETEVPGIPPNDISIYLYSSRIEIKGMKKEDLCPSGIKYLRLEREYGKFRRTIALPCSVLPEKAKAFLENGILTLTLKKYKKKKEKEVMVKIQKTPD